MPDPGVPRTESKKDWVLTQGAFHRLLDWLDEGADSGGSRYIEIRRRLFLYFDRKNCVSPDELADETLNRVARRLEEEGAIVTDTPAHYCYIVARFVFHESLRGQQVHEQLDVHSGNPATRAAAGPEASAEKEEKERRSKCLEQCLGNLDSDDRQLIVGYYRGEQRAKIENRKAMAASLGVSMNALTIRACRIRDKLEACLHKCLSGGG